MSSKTSVFGWIRRWQPEHVNCIRTSWDWLHLVWSGRAERALRAIDPIGLSASLADLWSAPPAAAI
jgi:hypothetical protein